MFLSLFFIFIVVYICVFLLIYHCTYTWSFNICLFLVLFVLFLERGGEREKERERNINVWLPLMWPPLGTWPSIQACALTGNWTSNPLVHSLCSIHWATPARSQLLPFNLCTDFSVAWSTALQCVCLCQWELIFCDIFLFIFLILFFVLLK